MSTAAIADPRGLPVPGAAAAGAVLARVAVLGALLFAAGCSGTKAPAQVTGNIVASAQVNPSVSRRPSPLLVRVYELKSVAAFNAADFMALYQGDQAALGADLLAREEIMLQPGESRPLQRTLAPETRFIGVVAAYRNLERAVWRASVAVKPAAKQTLTIRADELAVRAELAK
jgi:type VI secretion system protein VasD